MRSATIFALSAFSALVAAAPVKRDIVWVTRTQEYVETVVLTTTLYPNAQGVQTAAEAQTTAGEFFPTQYRGPTHKAKHTKKPVSKDTEAAVPTSTSTSYGAKIPTTTSSVYVAPTPTSTYVAPTSTYVAPTSTYVPPTTTTPVYTPPAATSVAAAAVSTPAVSSSNSGSEDYSGAQLTYYTPGLGACGWTNTESDNIVALAAGMMGEQSNGNPWCGKKITITYNGVSEEAEITDKCPGCSGTSLDLSPSLFAKFAALGEGRLFDASWSVN